MPRPDRALRLPACALALAFAACTPSRPEPPATECAVNSDCPEGATCSATGACTTACKADRDCLFPLVCKDLTCQNTSGRCLRDADCGTGESCSANGSCARTCAVGADCGQGFACIGYLCLAAAPECAKAVDCGAGRTCLSGTCATACLTAAECLLTETCAAGACVATPPECVSSSTCPTGQVCGPGGRCAARCALDVDCGAGQTCSAGACLLLPAECARNSDCPEGKSCVAGACADPCASERDCPAGHGCTGGACVAVPPECVRNSDCPEGKNCVGGKCSAACVDSRDCVPGYTCNQGSCDAVPPECVRNSDCAADQVCVASRCAAACVGSRDCGPHQLCDAGVCVDSAPECARTSDCPPGKACVAGACAAQCVGTSDCDLRQICNLGVCEALPAECARASDCAAGKACVAGACADQCVDSRDCPAGQTCTLSTCQPTPPQCVRNSDCAAGKACLAGGCGDACVDARDCGAGEACAAGACAVPALECLEDSHCPVGEACSPTGGCVAPCATGADCSAAGEVCVNGACVVVGPSTAGLDGSVLLAGIADASGLAVTVSGAGFDRAVTRSDGTFAFAGLPPGRYVVAVQSTGTAQGTVERQAFARAGETAHLSPIDLTPVGELKGSARLSGATSHRGIQVFALGTAVGTVTDAAGGYTLRGLPLGTYDVVATYPGYLAEQVDGVPVAWGAPGTAAAMTLSQVPVGSTFAFLTTPPTTVEAGAAYAYTAKAGGGGVGAVTYSLAGGPAGMTVDPASGLVSYLMDPAGGSFTVALAATGGGMTVYQVFVLSSGSPLERVAARSTGFVDTAGGVTWALHLDGSVTRVEGGTVTHFDQSTGAVKGPVTAVEILNGGAVTSLDFQHGTTTSLAGPFGTLSVSYQGGTVQSFSPMDTLAVAAAHAVETTGVAAALQGADTVTAVAVQPYLRGTAEQVQTGLEAPTGIAGSFGVATAVTADTLTDATKSWATDVYKGKCLMDPGGKTKVATAIAGNTATTLSLPAGSADLTQGFFVGQRFFVVGCSDSNMTITLENAAASYTASLVNRYADLYSYGRAVAAYKITASDTTHLSFSGPPATFLALAEALGAAAYSLTNTSQKNTVTLVDPEGTLPADLTASYNVRLGAPAAGAALTITASTATSITYTVNTGQLAGLAGPVDYFVTPKAAFNLVQVSVAKGGLTAHDFAGKFLYFDRLGDEYKIADNAESSFTVQVPDSVFPPTLVGSLVGVSAADTAKPTVVVDVAGAPLVPDAWKNKLLLQVQASDQLAKLGTVLGNTASQLTLAVERGAGTVPAVLAAVPGARLVMGDTSTEGCGVGDAYFDVALAGSPGLIPNLLAGSTVVDLDGLVAATVVSNGTGSLVVRVSPVTVISAPCLARFSDFEHFDRLQAGATLIYPVRGTAFRVQLSAAGAAWAADQWAGYRVHTTSQRLVGTVYSNTADTLVLADVAWDACDALKPGDPFALAPSAFPGGAVPVEVRLAGAALSPNAYSALSVLDGTTVSTFAVASNDATSVRVVASLADLLPLAGRPAALSLGSQLAFEVGTDLAGVADGSLAGARLALAGQRTPAVLANAGGTLTLAATAELFLKTLSGALAPGARFTVADASGRTRVVVHTDVDVSGFDWGLREVRLFGAKASTPLTTLSAAPGAVTGESADAASLLGSLAGGAYDALTTSAGAVLRVRTSAPLPPGGLVGRIVALGARKMEIQSNDASSMVVADPDPAAVLDARAATAFEVLGLDARVGREDLDVRGALVALAGGEALVAVNQPAGGVFRLGAGGLVAAYTRHEAATRYAVRAVPALATGTIAAETETASTPGWGLAVDPSWNWAENEAAGSVLVFQPGASATWTRTLIGSNTAHDVTYQKASALEEGARYFIDPCEVELTSGATLGANALRGARVLLNGQELKVRSNTATRVKLHCTQAYLSPLADPVSGTLTVLGSLPSSGIESLAADGAGFWAVSGAGVTRFDGSLWQHWRPQDTVLPLASGTVTGAADGVNFKLSQATTGNLYGALFVTSYGLTMIQSNSGTDLQTWSMPLGGAAVTGDAYSIVRLDALPSGGALTASVAGGTLFVGTGSGLVRRSGGSWLPAWTVGSTESAMGLADGLPRDRVPVVEAASATEVWMGCRNKSGDSGATTSWTSGSWTQWSVAGTESAPGLADGLPHPHSNGFFFTPGVVWAATDGGVARYEGGRWTRLPRPQGTSTVWDVAVDGATVWFASPAGLDRYTP